MFVCCVLNLINDGGILLCVLLVGELVVIVFKYLVNVVVDLLCVDCQVISDVWFNIVLFFGLIVNMVGVVKYVGQLNCFNKVDLFFRQLILIGNI